MRIGFDIQALQTPSKNRGIGRYSHELLKSLLQIDDINKYIFIYNSMYKDTPSDLFGEQRRIKNHYVSYLNNGNNNINDAIQELNYNYLNLDILHILSPFEHPQSACIMRDLIRSRSILVSTLYDLIPLIFSHHYLQDPETNQYYSKRLKILYDSDMIFSISESSRRDAINLLGIPGDRIVNIGGASSDKFHKLGDISEDIKHKILSKYGIKGKYVLYTGGIDFRKNMKQTIEAFSKIKKALLNEHNLVIVCSAHDEEKNDLLKHASQLGIGEKVVFTGYIPDDDLNLLYNLCELFIFPSLYEGFGLPIVEAMKCGSPVITSNTSSMPEIIDRNDCLFNPLNTDEIADSMSNVLSKKAFRNELADYSLKRALDFTWKKVGRRALDAYWSLANDKFSSERIYISKVIGKLKVAYFTPLPPIGSGIADYSSELIPYLSKYFDIDIFVDNYNISNDFLRINYNIFNYRDFERMAAADRYEIILYQFGNSEYHEYMYDILMKYPGVVVLHDFYLSDFVYYLSCKRYQSLDFFIKEVLHSHGERGDDYIKGNNLQDVDLKKIIIDLPINKRVLDKATGVIVHSSWAKQNIFSYYPEFFSKPVHLINQHMVTLLTSDIQKLAVREKLRIDSDLFTIVSFGLGHQTKRLDLVLKLFSKFLKKYPDSIYIIVGRVFDDYKIILDKIIRDLDISDKVIFTGYIDNETYKDYLSISDVCINLRYPTRGETSASFLRALGAGIPTIVNDDAYFSELPDDVVIKVPVGKEDDIVDILCKLYGNKDLRKNYSEKSLNYISNNHSVDKTARDYAHAIFDVQSRRPFATVDGAIEHISDRLMENREVNLGENDLDIIANQIYSMFSNGNK